MAEDSGAGEKTEAPTPRKIRESREKGSVAKSSDLNAAILLCSGFCLLFFYSSFFIREFSILLETYISALSGERVDQAYALSLFSGLIKKIFYLLVPVSLGLFVMGILVNLGQVGVLITFKPLAPDFGRINPLKGFGRIFSKRGLMRFLFGLFKLICIGVVLTIGFREVLNPVSVKTVFGLFQASTPQAMAVTVNTIFDIAIKAGITLLILAIFDFSFQRWQHTEDLKMTKQEVREEMKQMEGDPKVKDRRRRIQQKLVLQRMMQDVPQADVVITNPTHVSCALQYKEGSMSAPKLLAKGKGEIAHRIRELAIAEGIPIVEKPPLARLIFSTTEVGAFIPEDLYQPVAEVLSYVYSLDKSRAKSKA